MLRKFSEISLAITVSTVPMSTLVFQALTKRLGFGCYDDNFEQNTNTFFFACPAQWFQKRLLLSLLFSMTLLVTHTSQYTLNAIIGKYYNSTIKIFTIKTHNSQ